MDLISAYSNREDLVFELEHALRQLGRAQKVDGVEPRVSVRSEGRVGRAHGLKDRLSQADRQKIILSYEAGELRRDIAERYGISVSSVARVLREWRTTVATTTQG